MWALVATVTAMPAAILRGRGLFDPVSEPSDPPPPTSSLVGLVGGAGAATATLSRGVAGPAGGRRVVLAAFLGAASGRVLSGLFEQQLGRMRVTQDR
eukprot:5117033-Prymnesium_polylepis.1